MLMMQRGDQELMALTGPSVNSMGKLAYMREAMPRCSAMPSESRAPQRPALCSIT